ncbi:hypothetical protein [Aeromicrobium fastidiosum]|uniref:Uncharacterized protein n=1 Tax=Aeromicrobium fastidiosum TaxID=52699 RepID=A0A641AQQ7_9ACTN|nr:hypothetical protein [Aeromicrobium fastidiosum]KAA1380430.1 hypothetical protein ESP62_004405 [Aeromicrobium fastidiosum]MBP2390007.1 hypothetical protein [Aeromicrobium fastidiosum]
MRRSVLSRSIVGAVSLAVASVALTAAPSSAATPAPVTRDMVLSVANDLLAPGDFYAPGVYETLENIAATTCGVAEPSIIDDVVAEPLNGAGAVGLVVRAFIVDADDVNRECSFGALTTTVASDFVLSGQYSFSHEVLATGSAGPSVPVAATPGQLSGNLVITAPVSYTDRIITGATMTASGRSSRTTDTTTFTRIETPKSAKQLRAAKATYKKRLAAVKKTYANSIKKARTKKGAKKKAALDLARRKHTRNLRVAKDRYRHATATFKLRRSGGIVGTFNDFNVTATSRD